MQLLPAIFLAFLTTRMVQAQDCICTADYLPVCVNGKTYGNKCEASCAGEVESELMAGACLDAKL